MCQTQAIQHRAKEEGEVDKCKAAIIDAQAIVDTRRATAADAKQAVYALQVRSCALCGEAAVKHACFLPRASRRPTEFACS